MWCDVPKAGTLLPAKHITRPGAKNDRGLVDESVVQQFTSVEGNVNIGVAEFLKLVRHASAQDKADEARPIPVPWQVVSLDVSAETGTRCVSFTVNFLVRSLVSEWVEVPLLPAFYALDKFSVSGQEVAIVKSSSEAAGENGEDNRQPSIVSGSSSAVVSVLLPRAGDYRVSMSGQAPFENERKSGFKLKFEPDVLRTSLSCTVHDADLDIKVEQALSTVREALPPNPPLAVASTRVNCLLGHTKTVSVQWTARRADEELDLGGDAEEAAVAAGVEVQKDPLVVANHVAVHTIGEGVVSTSLTLEYEIIHNTRSVFDILCPVRANVIEVVGKHIKHWKVLNGPAPTAAVPEGADVGGLDLESDSGSQATGLATSEVQPGQKVIRVMLHFPVQGKYALSITSDLPMAATSCAVSVPVFDAQGANRQKGYVGIEARTNVEVREVKKVGVVRVDVSELPEPMIHSGRSYLQAYKFLVPKYAVELDVKRHVDAEVLTAVIEDAWLTATVSESGSALFRVLVALRNTQRQFLRISLPERRAGQKKADIWSAMVNGVAVKPSVDNEDTVLIPLLEATPRSEKSSSVLYVELVFLESVQVMANRGKLSLTFSRFDLPVQRMFVKTNLPVNFVYGQFEGDLKEVPRHGKEPPRVSPGGELSRPAVPRTRARMERLSSSRMERRMSIASQGAYCGPPSDSDSQESDVEEASGALDRGVVPVAIGAMEEGTPFLFETLLVQNEAYTLSVPYKRQHITVRQTSRCCVAM